MKTIAIVRLPQTLADFAELKKLSDYSAVMRFFKKSKHSIDLQRKMIGKNQYKNNPQKQEEYIRIIEEGLEDQKLKIQQCQAIYQSAKDNVERALQQLKKAKKTLADAENALKEARNMENAEKALQSKLETTLLEQTKKLEQIKVFALVHPSATLTALDKKINHTFVLTRYDLKNMNLESFADIIEDTDSNLIDSEIKKEALEKFHNQSNYESAIEYVNMVIKYWIENKPFVLLYNDDGIRYILERIGVIAK
ncbi:MAG: hypothetical protein ACI4VH_04575 [Clostridia bacterium]